VTFPPEVPLCSEEGHDNIVNKTVLPDIEGDRDFHRWWDPYSERFVVSGVDLGHEMVRVDEQTYEFLGLELRARELVG
jgi:hypothetical protein